MKRGLVLCNRNLSVLFIVFDKICQVLLVCSSNLWCSRPFRLCFVPRSCFRRFQDILAVVNPCRIAKYHPCFAVICSGMFFGLCIIFSGHRPQG